MPRARFAVLPLVGVLLGGAGAAAEVRVRSVESACASLPLFSRCELTVFLEGPITNPYDPDEVTLQAVFRPPEGDPVTVEGFYYQPFEVVPDGEREILRPSGEPVWKIRFTPRQRGRWSSEIRLVTPSGVQRVGGEPFIVVGSSGSGFIRLNRTDRNFWFETGQPFIPIGESLCWGSRRQYRQWFRELASQHANYIRVWLAPWSLSLETTETGLGRYDQARAWLLDELLERSGSAGLFWQLCLLNHRSFVQSGESDWHANPYNAQRGGVCQRPNEFLTSPEARAMFQRSLRYLVNRWGYSPQIAVWELFNEGDLGEFSEDDLTAWVADTSAFLRSIDVNQRPITTSFYQDAPEAVWRLPTIDLIQLHRYDERDFSPVFASGLVPHLSATFDKPVIVGEFGWTDEVTRRFDDIGIHFHDGLWSSLMGGSAGTGLLWYWDSYIHPNRLERHFRALEAFWRHEQIGRSLQRLPVTVSDANLAGWGIGTSQRAFLWIKNRTHNLDRYIAYRCQLTKQRLQAHVAPPAQPVTYEPARVRGAVVTVEGLDWSGRYRVEWWDPYRGRISSRSVSRSRWGKVTVDVPEVGFDVAGKLIKLQWWQRS